MNNKRREEEKQKLLSLKNEITEMEKSLKEAKKENAKSFFLRNSRIALRNGRYYLPYVVIFMIGYGIFSGIGITPFKEDYFKAKKHIKRENDSRGNTRYEESFNGFVNSKNVVSSIGKWEMRDDESYCREILDYDASDINLDVLDRIINGDETVELEDIFGAPYSKRVEVKNNLTQDEINSESYIQTTVYSTSDDEYIYVEEGQDIDRVETLLYAIIQVSLCILYDKVIHGGDDNKIAKYKEAVKIIKEKYPSINVKELQKELVLKKANYQSLSR